MGKTIGPGQMQVVNGIDVGSVLLGGIEFVESGGNAIDTVIKAGGIQFVTSGGKASFDTVALGGVQNVGAYGEANSTTVNQGGLQTVAVNGRTDFATINGGTQYLRGLSYFSDLINGGIEDVGEHGYARYTTIEANSLQDVLANGYSDSAHVMAGGKQTVEATGRADHTKIDAGGIEVVMNGGRADYTSVAYNSVQDVHGTTNQDAVHGVQIIRSDGTDFYSHIYSGGIQEVLGTATGDFIDQGATQFVVGETDYAWLHGTQEVFKSAYAVNTDISSGGHQIVDGFAISSFVENGGLMTVDAGGAATKTEIDTGGTERVLNGGHELDVRFMGGGLLDLDDANSVGAIEGWQAGARVDLRDIAFGPNSSLGYDSLSGILSISDGQHTSYLHFLNPTGLFSASSDGHGGTLITDSVPKPS